MLHTVLVRIIQCEVVSCESSRKRIKWRKERSSFVQSGSISNSSRSFSNTSFKQFFYHNKIWDSIYNMLQTPYRRIDLELNGLENAAVKMLCVIEIN